MKTVLPLTLGLALAAAGLAPSAETTLEQATERINRTIAQGPFEPNWASLKTHVDPEWFRDAKFGIYTHWGPITVATEPAPAMMEWYGRELYQTNHPAFPYHQQRFGDQKTVGYKDVIPHFKAEKFNAEAWADLFTRAGAKFAGPVAIHHDHYANWASDLTRWNSRAVGPGRDLTGELAKALREHGLRFLTTFHHGFAWRYYELAYRFDAADPQFADLYAEPHPPNAPPSKRFLSIWEALVDEVLRKYQPDLIWFDFELGSVIPPEYRLRMFANTYNWAAQAGREIGVAHKHREIHQHTGILDFERGREDRLTPYPWLTDTSVGPWFHHDVAAFKTVNELVDVLVDIVAKNGCMLLNVGPKADGTIPDQGQTLLLGLGDWLKVNGPAIYYTRPWLVYGEGPTRPKGGTFSEEQDRRDYLARDLRFTQSKDGQTLYVIALDWPDQVMTVSAINVTAAAPDARVELLGFGPLPHRFNEAGQLVIQFPAARSGDHAFACRLSGFKVALQEAARFEQPEAIHLEPGKATLD
jgi:alpha-L-fucosidase